MILGIVLLAGGVLIVLIVLTCWLAGVPLGFPVRLTGGLAAFALGAAGALVVLTSEDRPDWVRDALSQLHRETVEHFSEREGFGANRMPVIPPMSQESRAIYQAFQSELDQKASYLHAEDKDFLKTWESDGPQPGAKTRWTVRKVQLVGLTKSLHPVVYLTDRLPTMDKVAEIPTRDLDEFENHALRLIRRGLKLHSKADGNHIRMMAPIYAAANCVKCHEGQGELLGAFTYEIERATVPHPADTKLVRDD
jgi:hypothetical protein